MASLLFNQAFIIYRLNTDDKEKPDGIIPYYTNEATYVAVCISICRGLLRHSTVKDAFNKLVEGYDPELPQNAHTEKFIDKILERFPIVFVDFSIDNPDLNGFHLRRPWVDEGNGFETRKQALVLNGRRVREMCISGFIAEKSNDPNSADSKRFRIFLFIFAKTLLHEVAHMFITYLGLGKRGTPPHMYAPGAVSSTGKQGEAGRYLEYVLLGGRVSVMRDPAEGKGQAGKCYITNEKGIHEVSQETIDEFIRYDFKFPINSQGPPKPSSVKTLGSGLPLTWPLSNPLYEPNIRANIQRLLETPYPITWDKVDDLMAENPEPGRFDEQQQAVMGRVPFEPSLRIQDPPEQLVQAAN